MLYTYNCRITQYKGHHYAITSYAAHLIPSTIIFIFVFTTKVFMHANKWLFAITNNDSYNSLAGYKYSYVANY